MTDEEKKVQIAEDTKSDLNGGNEKKSFTLEEVTEREEALKKEISGNHEKGVQKLTSKQKVLTTVLDNLDTIAETPEKLIDLFSENEEAAKVILDRYYKGQSIEEFKDDIGYTPDYTDPKVVEKLANDKANKIIAKKLITDKKDKFIKDLEMSGEELEKFEAEFEERKGLKSFNSDTLQKHLESAYRDSNGNSEALKKVKKDQIIADAMSSSEGKGGSKGTNKKLTSFDKARAEAKEMLGKYL